LDKVTYAGFWRRVISVIIDIVILWVPASLFRWSAPDLNITGVVLEVIDFMYLMLVWALYYGFTESSRYQATFGKLVMGLRVTNYNGEKISFLNAVGRFLGQFISLLPLGIGIFMIGWTKKKQGLHDIIASCLVIKKNYSA